MYIMEIFTSLPFWYQSAMFFLLGLIIGSFLNVVIYRFNTGRSINGHSHCTSCAYALRWYDLIPLLSFLFLKGRCKKCHCKIPLRYFVVELITALLFLATFMQFGFTKIFLFSIPLLSFLIVIALYDLNHMVIPDKLVLYVGILAIVHYFVVYGFVFKPDVLIQKSIAAMAAFLFFGGLWFVSKGRWIGFGDAKLAVPLAFILGPFATFSSIVFSFWIGAFVSILLLILPGLYKKMQHFYTPSPIAKKIKYFTMKSEVPFAPFMIAAFLLVYIYKIDVLQLMLVYT